MSEKKEMGFDEKLAKLEGIVKEIESGNLSLEDSMSLFEEGNKLIKELNDTLIAAKKKISDYTTVESK